MRPAAWLFLCLAPPACLTTRIEVVTEVGLAGDGLRTVTIVSEDDGKPAEHPKALRLPGSSYSVVERASGKLRAVGAFGDLNLAPPAFAFQLESLGRDSAGTIRYHTKDWALFTHCLYREQISDVVDQDDIKAALDEAAATLLELTEATLLELLGDDFEATLLRKRLRGDLREMARELVFMTWQEIVQPGEAEALGRWAARTASIAKKYGLKLAPGSLSDALSGGGDEGAEGRTPSERAIRRALSDWLATGLQPVRRGDRVPLVVDLDPLLFGGPFALEFEKQARKRFGAATDFEDWVEITLERVFGLFGPFGAGGSMEFTYKVKMPGDLIRTNGYLSRDGWAFVHFTQDQIYPLGAGVQCESVVWDYGVTSVLPGAGVVPGNETAIRWTFLLGEGPDSDPDPVLAARVRECAELRSLDPLRRFIEDSKGDGRRASKAKELLAWLEGQRG